jgi:demethylmenaquinone methyltransferase/2-methoxy-6-polyprenyl-1,4-benzoquinol methylase
MNASDPRIAYFDALADGWDQQEPSAETMVQGLARQADLLDLQPGQDLLEVGCGTGKTTGWLARAVAPGKVQAVDFSPEMIARARAKGIDADFACLDVCAGPWDANRYDVVLCFHSFPHFRDQAAALQNLARALKPKGRLLVMHLVGAARLNAFHAELDGPVCGDRLPVADQWGPLLAQAGLGQSRLIDREDLFFLSAVFE